MTDHYDRRTVLKALGAAGSIAATTSLAGCSGDGGGDGNGGETTTTEGGGNGGGGTTVEMTDDLVFDPDSITVSTGTTVTWENVGSLGHSVTAYEDEIPDDAEYFASGGADSEQAARDAYPSEGDVAAGETYEHTFEVAGTYEYFCIPHESAGMKGTVEVTE